MPIIYRTDSIFEHGSSVALVNPVNTRGVMGKGLALEFKKRYCGMYKAYRDLCARGAVKVGEVTVLSHILGGKIVLFPTKDRWKDPSKMEYIRAGLFSFTFQYFMHDIESVAFPRLGCGLGGLNWRDVRPVMEEYLEPLPIDVYIHEYTPGRTRK